MSKTIAELEEEFRYAEEGIEQMGEAWERGEYKDYPERYQRDVQGNATIMASLERKILMLKEGK